MKWYEELFSSYAQKYDNESFTKGTVKECDFIEKEIDFNKKLKILDVGCGTGRHSIELAKRGYTITGIDLSPSMLERAKEKAKKENLKNVKFLKKDARNFNFKEKFDVVFMMCEGAFPLMETDEMNYKILQNVTKSLKNKGKIIFTTLNGLFPIYNSVEKFHSEISEIEESDSATYRNNKFDLMTFRDHNITEIIDDNGKKKTMKCNERYYIPSEITWMLKSLGYKKIDIFGAKIGGFSRKDKLTVNDYEMLVVAEK